MSVYDDWMEGAIAQFDAGEERTPTTGERVMGGIESIGGGLLSGFSEGSSAGPIGAVIGLALGAIAGIGQTIQANLAIDAAAEASMERRKELEAELDALGRFNAHLENQIAQVTVPLEAQFRERARLFGVRVAGAGLSGSQAVAARIMAEQQYRLTIGPALPAIFAEASAQSRQNQLARLQAIEAKFGLDLSERKQALAEQGFMAARAGAGAGALIKGGTSLGKAIGDIIGEEQNRAAGQTPADQAIEDVPDIEDVEGV